MDSRPREPLGEVSTRLVFCLAGSPAVECWSESPDGGGGRNIKAGLGWSALSGRWYISISNGWMGAKLLSEGFMGKCDVSAGCAWMCYKQLAGNAADSQSSGAYGNPSGHPLPAPASAFLPGRGVGRKVKPSF